MAGPVRVTNRLATAAVGAVTSTGVLTAAPFRKAVLLAVLVSPAPLVLGLMTAEGEKLAAGAAKLTLLVTVWPLARATGGKMTPPAGTV